MSSRGKYRWRTNLRARLPFRPPIYRLVPKGKKDCGDHEWYFSHLWQPDEAYPNVWVQVWGCYHCEVGFDYSGLQSIYASWT